DRSLNGLTGEDLRIERAEAYFRRGCALNDIAHHEDDPRFSERAIACWDQALPLVSKKDEPRLFVKVCTELGQAHARLSMFDDDDERLDKAIGVLEQALTVQRGPDVARPLAEARMALGAALLRRGKQRDNDEDLNRATAML